MAHHYAKMPGIGLGRHPNTLKQCRLNGYNPNSLKALAAKCHLKAENIQKRRLPMYDNIITWLEENITEPTLVENEFNSDYVNIWFTVLNTNSVKAFEDVEGIQANRIMCKFLWSIKDYVPSELITADFYNRLGHIQKSDYADELVKKFCAWYCNARVKLENYLAKEYFVRGRMKDVEILKRRYKQDWSESKVVEAKVEADQNIKSDNKIEINIKDA